VKKQASIFFFLFLLAFSAAEAQPTLDTIKYCLKQKPRPFAKLDSRNSFIDNSVVNIFGAIAGINFGKRLSFGIGYNQLYNPPKNFNQDVEYINSFGKPYFVSSGIHFFYVSAAIDYAFYQTKHWEISMPLQIGIGQTYFSQTIHQKRSKIDAHTNFIYEPTISVDYKIVKWFGLGIDFGYRFLLTNDVKLNREFNSPIVTFGLVIYYSEIYKSVFPNTKLAKKM
jgi:hypothetical protein